YRRTYDSEFTAPLVAHYTWPALVQGSEVVARGEACTRRGAATSSTEAIDLSGGLDCHQLHRHPHHTGYHGNRQVKPPPSSIPGSVASMAAAVSHCCCCCGGRSTQCCNRTQRNTEYFLEISDQDLARLPGGLESALLSIMDKSSLSSSCYAIHLPPPTQHVYESYNSEERDNDEDTACYHDAQSRLRPSRQQLLNSSRPTGASAAGHHEAADVDPCGELLSTRRRRTSSSSRMNRDEHSLQHHHY
uniref:Mitochondria-eating protein n=1 Tax=Macrostomum lignano TaxID=282301 RepID=A0A1I8F7Q7_9PLAT